MFNFLSKVSSHKKIEDKIQQIKQKGLDLSHNYVVPGQSSEFGQYYDKKGAIKIDNFVADTTRFLSTDLYEVERRQAIEKYRYISMLPECDDAIEEIVNESIVMSENDDHAVRVDFTTSKYPKEIRDRIIDEFEYIRDNLLDFSNRGHYYFRNWYIDGSIYFEKVFDEDNLRLGIQKINMLDTRFVSYYAVFDGMETGFNTMKKQVDEFFVIRQPMFANRYYRTEGMYSYPSNSTQTDGMIQFKIPSELIAYVDSGLYHPSREYPLSYLHKALKVANQLTMLEDALLVYRITRAPERRVFYIEVGNLPTNTAEAHIQDVMRNYRQEKIYDVNTGTIKDRNAVFSMTEDFWLPRRNGTSSTEVTTLAGGQNLDQVADLEYFARKIWRALSVPYARRADKENSGVQYNSGRELSLEELKFYKYILKLRRQFSKIFRDLLATQLLVKRVVNSTDIDEVMSNIKFTYSNSNYFNEFLKLEVLDSKLNVVNSIDGFVGKYVSMQYVWKEVFNFSDEQIYQEVQRMKREKQGDFLGTGTVVSTEPEGEQEGSPEEGMGDDVIGMREPEAPTPGGPGEPMGPTGPLEMG